MNWRSELEEVRSLGLINKKASTLAELHDARRIHLGQFFTPLDVAAFMWRIASQAFDSQPGRIISLLDNSIGSARTLHFATPDRFTIGGFDVHRDVVENVQKAAEAAGFASDIIHCGMEDADPKGFDIALINPPFSIHIEAAHLNPFPCTTWGRYGKNSSAQSDEYALAQALNAARVVVAVLPGGLASDVLSRGDQILGKECKRLRAVFKLPAGAFREQGTDVQTSVVVFGPPQVGQACIGQVKVLDIKSHDIPHLRLELDDHPGKAQLRVRSLNTSQPVITLPVTGDKVVRIVHSGRKIHLKCGCGLMQAKVYNTVLREVARTGEEMRLPRNVKYSGQGRLDVQCLLTADDPLAALDGLAHDIRCLGADVRVDDGLRGHIRKLVKARALATEPFGHWIFAQSHESEVLATAKKPVALDPTAWVTPMIRVGEKVTLSSVADGWLLTKEGKTRILTRDEAPLNFEMPAAEEGWREVYPPLQSKFPQHANSLSHVAISLGIDKWLDWEYQFQDLLEVSMRPRGAIVSWKQGLGKARLAAALILIHRVKHGLVVMPAGLLGEYVKRLVSAGLPESMWKVIDGASALDDLRQINIISYERLRMPLSSVPGARARMAIHLNKPCGGVVEVPKDQDVGLQAVTGGFLVEYQGGSRLFADEEVREHLIFRRAKTYAHKLRRRFSVVVADEGEVLANPESLQSIALWQLAARKFYVCTGTPMANYPRNLHPIAAKAAGDGVVGQAYGYRQPLLSDVSLNSMSYSSRGQDAFRDEFVSFDWVTDEFADTLQTGAKREIPRIKNLGMYRDWLSPFVKRRLPKEPQVAKHVQIPEPKKLVLVEDWDEYHLAYYLRVADEFAHWYRSTTPYERASNFLVLLARISAVVRACDVPQAEAKHGVVWRGGLTSKQRLTVQRVKESVERGEKSVVFAESPRLLEVLSAALAREDIESVMFHGEIPKPRRERELDHRFRDGPAPVLLATKGTMRAGFDLYCATRFFMADRDWSATREDQAAHRLLRPQQKEVVVGEYFELAGSIGAYQAQMVQFKANTADAGLDWATPIPDDVEFLHLDTILGRFVDALAKRDGMTAHRKREALKAFA